MCESDCLQDTTQLSLDRTLTCVLGMSGSGCPGVYLPATHWAHAVIRDTYVARLVLCLQVLFME